MSIKMRLKTAIKVGFWITAVLFILITSTGFLGYLVLQLPPVQKQVVNVVQNRIDSLLVGEVSIGSVSTNLFSLLDIRELSFRNSNGNGDSLYIGHIRVRYRLHKLLQRHIAVSSLQVNNCTASITVQPGGRVVLPFLPKETNSDSIEIKADTSSHPFFTFSIGGIRINNLAGVFIDPVNQQSAFIEDADITAEMPVLDSILILLRHVTGRYKSNWWSGIVRKGFADVELTSKQLNIKQLVIDADSSSVEGKGIIPFTRNGEWDIAVKAASPINALPVIYRNTSIIEKRGGVTAEASWIGPMNRPELNLDLNAHNVEINGVKAETLQIAADYDTSCSLSFSADLFSRTGRVALQGDCTIPALFITPSLGAYSIDCALEDIDIEKITASFVTLPTEFAGVHASVQLHAEGAGISRLPEKVSIKGGGRDGLFFKNPVTFSGNLESGRWKAGSEMAGNSLQARGQLFENRTITGTAVLQIENPSALVSMYLDDSVTGSIHSHFSFHGPLDSLSMEVETEGAGLGWRSAFLDTLSASISFNKPNNVLRNLYLEGSISLDTLLVPFGIDSLSGMVFYRIEGRGNLLQPVIKADVNGSTVSYERYNIDSLAIISKMRGFDSISLQQGRIYCDSHRVRFDCAGLYSVKKRSGSLTLGVKAVQEGGRYVDAGTAALAGSYSHTSCTGSLHVSHLALKSFSSFLFSDDTVSGMINCTGSVTGSTNNPIINISLAAESIGFRQYALHSVNLKGELQDSVFDAEGRIRFFSGQKPVEVAAILPLKSGFSWNIDTAGRRNGAISVTADGVDLSPFSIYLDSAWELTGSAVVSLNAYISNVGMELGGSLDVFRAGVRAEPLTLLVTDLFLHTELGGTVKDPYAHYHINCGPIRVAGEQVNKLLLDGKITTEFAALDTGKLLLSDSGLVLLNGVFPWKSDDTLQPLLNQHVAFDIVHFPLRLLQPFITDYTRIDGIVKGNGSFFYKDGKPGVEGVISLQNGTVALEEVFPPVGPIMLTAEMSGDSIVIPEVSVLWGDKGKVSGGGKVRLKEEGDPEVNFSISAERLNWGSPDIYDASVEKADLRLVNSEDGYRLEGTVTLGETRYIENIQITDIVTQLRSNPALTVQKEPDPFLGKVGLQVALDLQENVEVDMNLGYVKLDGECLVTGSLGNPSYTGEIQLSDGYILYLDRRFTIEEATLSNFRPNKLNPVINLEANAEVVSFTGDQAETYTIQLTLKGNIDNPIFLLREKSGTLNELEIISLLTFGQLLGGMNEGARDRIEAFVKQSIIGLGARKLKLEQRLGIERIELQGDPFSNGSSGNGARLTIAKRVTPRLMVLYETDVDAVEKLRQPKLTALYRITNNLFVSGERKQDGDAGVDLLLKFSR